MTFPIHLVRMDRDFILLIDGRDGSVNQAFQTPLWKSVSGRSSPAVPSTCSGSGPVSIHALRDLSPIQRSQGPGRDVERSGLKKPEMAG